MKPSVNGLPNTEAKNSPAERGDDNRGDLPAPGASDQQSWVDSFFRTASQS